MKINNFQGELTGISAIKEALELNSNLISSICCTGNIQKQRNLVCGWKVSNKCGPIATSLETSQLRASLNFEKHDYVKVPVVVTNGVFKLLGALS